MDMDDAELIRRIVVSHETSLYGEVVRRYGNSVYASALGLVRDDDKAREVAQQAFVRAYTRLRYWHGGNLGAWLSAIAMHVALNEMKRRRRRAAVPIDDNALSLADDDDFQEHERKLASMEEAISRLPDEERELLRLHYSKGLKTAEIARKTGLTQSNVLVRLHRIREKLKKTLMKENYGDDE